MENTLFKEFIAVYYHKTNDAYKFIKVRLYFSFED